MTNFISSSVGRTLLRYHVGVALPLPRHWALAHHWALFSCLRYAFVCAVHLSVLCSGSWCCLGRPQPPQLNWARVYCGCEPGPTRVLPMPRQYSIGRRAPALRTLATSYDFKETWIIDVSSCTPPRPVRVHDLVDFGITSLNDFIHLFNHELLTHARRHVAWLCTAMSRPIQPELPW